MKSRKREKNDRYTKKPHEKTVQSFTPKQDKTDSDLPK